MKYYFTFVKKRDVVNVGCLAIKIVDDEVVKEKILIEQFPEKNLKEEVFKVWTWASKLKEEDKVWVDSSTTINPLADRYLKMLLKKVNLYTPTNFLNYSISDLQSEFKNKHGKDATSFELNYMVSQYFIQLKQYFEDNPNMKRNVPLVKHLQMRYEHTGEKISLDSIFNTIDNTILF